VTSLESWHEYFERLSALWAANQTSSEEECLLAEHAQSCSACRQAMEQYRQIVVQTYGETAGYSAPVGSSGVASEPDVERLRAKERLFTDFKGRVLLPAPDKIRAAARNGNKVKPPGQIRQPILSWAGWAVAAVVLLGVAMGASQYRLTEKRSREVETKATAIEKEIAELHRELARAQTELHEAVVRAAPDENRKLEDFKAANEALRRNLANAEVARQREASDNAELRDHLRMLKSSLDVLRAEKANTEVEKAGLAERVASLTAEARKSQDEMTRITARNDELSQQALSQVRYLERQQKLLATDHDIRDILGSRSLRIIDVYDVTSQGEFEHPFGRIFYREGQSLIFYAFDLDQQRGLKRGAVFQAWGQKGEGKEEPLNLGAFYMDDPSQNRWVLKVDDGRALAHVEYVFVTDGSRKEVNRPKGKPLLSAFLRKSPDHP